MLGDAVIDLDRERIVAEVTLRKTQFGKAGDRLDTRMGELRGERRLVVADCLEATHATALLLALLINPHVDAALGDEDVAEWPKEWRFAKRHRWAAGNPRDCPRLLL